MKVTLSLPLKATFYFHVTWVCNEWGVNSWGLGGRNSDTSDTEAAQRLQLMKQQQRNGNHSDHCGTECQPLNQHISEVALRQAWQQSIFSSRSQHLKRQALVLENWCLINADLWECKLVQLLWIQDCFTSNPGKVEDMRRLWPSNSSPRLILYRILPTGAHSTRVRLLLAALFVILSTQEWIPKLWYICTTEKMPGPEGCVSTCICLTNILLIINASFRRIQYDNIL